MDRNKMDEGGGEGDNGSYVLVYFYQSGGRTFIMTSVEEAGRAKKMCNNILLPGEIQIRQ
jgi:hypothetical protein